MKFLVLLIWLQQNNVRKNRKIKNDTFLCTSFKDYTAWDNWIWGFVAHARAQDVVDILNPAYISATGNEKRF